MRRVRRAGPRQALWEEKWIEVRSPHFVVVSALADRRTVELVTDLESFRAAAEMFPSIRKFADRVPTRAYLLPYPDADVGMNGVSAGIFFGGMRANYLAVIPSGILNDAMKHEYGHYLVRSRGESMYPTWFDEGFAEVVSSLRVHGTDVDVGNPLPRHEWRLGFGDWLSFTEILEALGTANIGLMHRYGEFFMALAGATKDTAQAHRHWLDARAHFARSRGLDANIPETLVETGLTFLAPGETADQALPPLELAYRLLPSNPDIRLSLAAAYAANHRPDDARLHLRALLAWADARNVDALNKALAEVDKLPAPGDPTGATTRPPVAR